MADSSIDFPGDVVIGPTGPSGPTGPTGPTGPGTGDYEFVSTVVISDDASIEYQDIPSGYDYIYYFENLKPANDDVDIYAQTSPDAGGSPVYDAGTSYSDQRGAAQSAVAIFRGLGSTGGECMTVSFWLFNPGGTGFTLMKSQGTALNISGNSVNADNYHGVRHSEAVVQAIKFTTESGNLESGNIHLFRRKLT